MNRSNDDINILKKVNMIVQDKLPGFASRYFRANMDIKTPRTLYGYAIDLTSFFCYLETISFETKKMTISDLNKITPEIIEDYLDYSLEYVEKGEVKTRSEASVHRRYSSLSSFLDYFYRSYMIDQNPASRVVPPRPKRYITPVKSVTSHKEILDYISNNMLEGRKGAFQEKTKIRDTAIVMLMAGAGLKVSDIVSLNIEDLNLKENTLVLSRKRCKKTVYFSDIIGQALGNYLVQRLDVLPEKGHDNALFLSLKYKRICIRSVEKMLKKYAEAAGYADITPESIHQSFCSNVFNQPLDIPVQTDICGLNKRTVLLYYRPYIDDYESHKGENFN